MNLRIRTDGSLYVSAPYFITASQAEKFILQKQDFILKGLSEIKNRDNTSCREHKLEPNEVFWVFGESKSLEYVSALIGVEPTDPDKFLKTYEKYRRRELIYRVSKFCDEVYPYFRKCVGLNYPEIKFRTMTSRWGVCVPAKNRITFSYNLFEAPPECIRYVVCHEFTHFLVPNHSDKFYEELEKTCPDWKRWRQELKKYSN